MATLCTSKDQTDRQFSAMIWDFIQAYNYHDFTAPDVTIALRSGWGIRADWHDISIALERMLQSGRLAHAGLTRDRQTQYRLKAVR
jgi:hypothetical protein